MLPTLIIVFREMLEAGLILGIALAVTRAIPSARRWIAYGAAAGIAGSLVVAASAAFIARSFQGAGQELFNATALGLAAVMLGWHNIWMARHGKELAGHLKSAADDIATGLRDAGVLAVVVGVAVLREGSEVVLFLFGVASAGDMSAAQIVAGLAGGLLLGGAVSALLYFGLLRIPMRYLFATTGVLITLLAAGMAAQAMTFLQQAGFFGAWLNEVWDTSAWLPQSSVIGNLLHILIGYIDRPTVAELAVWIGVVAVITVLAQAFKPARKAPANALAGE
jgi:high-affinity iron transporter